MLLRVSQAVLSSQAQFYIDLQYLRGILIPLLLFFFYFCVSTKDHENVP